MHDAKLPNNDAWISRFKDLRDWTKAHGRLPRENLSGGPEDTLYTWLERQRTAWHEGLLDENLTKILRMIHGAVTSPNSAGPTKKQTRLDRLEAFHSLHGRLPAFAGEARDERAMYSYLNSTVRVMHRKGELSADTKARLENIPGVLVDIYQPRKKTTDRAESTLLKLIDFGTDNGRLPRQDRPEPEPTLYSYLCQTLRPAYAAGALDEDTILRLDKAMPGCLLSPQYHNASGEQAKAA